MADFKKPKGGGGGGGSNSALELLVFGALAAVIVTYFGGLLQPIIQPVNFLFEVRNYFAPWFSNNLWWLQVLAVVLSGIFLWGIVHIISATNYINMKKEQFLEPLGKDYVSRRRSLIAWNRIQQRLASEDSNNWKIAILEAERILNEILKMSGYLGKLSDQLKILTEEQLKNIEDVGRAYAIGVKIKNDPSFVLTQDEAKEVIGVYEQSFRELNLIREE